MRLYFKEATLSGGDNGKVIVAGKSGESLLLLSVLDEDEDTRMPPLDKGAPLTPAEVAVIRAWIDRAPTGPTVWMVTRQRSDSAPIIGRISRSSVLNSQRWTTSGTGTRSIGSC